MSPTATNPPDMTRCRCICPNGCDCGCTCPAAIELQAEQAARRAANGGPIRIQRKRIPGWRKRDNAVIEAEYSNPRRACVSHYRAWLEGSTEYPDTFVVGGKTFDRRRVLADLDRLRGRDLACPCPLPDQPDQPDHCHAQVLLELANTPKENPPA